MAKIADKLSKNDMHFRSLVCSLVMGQTKYDALTDSEAAAKGKNLLIREVYRVFEKAIRVQYGEKMEKAQIDQFLQQSFKKNAPLYLILMLTEDKNLIESLFNVMQRFNINLIDLEKDKEKEIKYLKSFYNFLDPFNALATIKPLLR